ncbi:hypothetical protein NMG60_11004677 [Bertholletia excelsa]
MTIPENEPVALSLADNLLQSVLDSIPRTLHFKSKWSLISTKLTHLRSQLSDLSDYPTHPLSLELLRALSLTLSDALSLSSACHQSTIPAGKLKTQNDVDSISAQIDRHVADTEVLVKSGVFQDSPRRSVSNSRRDRESIRVGARNVITRLQIGTSESKNSAMDEMLRLIHEDDRNVLIAVAQGAVPVLVRLLDSGSPSPEIREKAVAAISRVSTVDSSKHLLIAEGLLLINHLIRVVESGSGFAREKACVALEALSHSKDNARAIGSRCGVSALLEICRVGTPGSRAVAAVVLRNLSEVPENRENFIEENAIQILLSLAASGTISAQENAIGCLCRLVSDDDQLKLLIAREGVIDSLKIFWDSATDRSLEVAVELLRHLASFPLIAEVIVSEGFLTRIVSALNCGVLSVRIAAAMSVYELGSDPSIRKELGEIECIPPLARMLYGKAAEERDAAARALSALMGCAGNRRIFRRAERGIVSAVQMLDPLVQNVDKKYPVSLLASLMHSKGCRKQMVAAGARGYLQKLSETEVEGAKKLLEGLGKGKLWGVFARS